MKKDVYNVAIVGATGAVGVEMLRILEERRFPIGELRLIASARSEGREMEFQGERLGIQALGSDSFRGIHIALFSAGSSVSREFAPIAARSGAVVIDNSSAFRMEPDVPLVVPEINSHTIGDFRKRGIIANPNCTTAIALMALKPIHDAARLRRVVATSFQAVSGAGAQAIEELKRETLDWAYGRPIQPKVFPHQIAFNVIPHIDSFLENGYTKEEMKLHHETRKILDDDGVMVTATTVRVPVFRAHCVSLNVETERGITPEEAREVFSAFPGLEVVDEPHKNAYPLPIDAAGKDSCFVGRIRADYTLKHGLSFWVAGDQLRKGAALNAIQIAEVLIRDHVS